MKSKYVFYLKESVLNDIPINAPEKVYNEFKDLNNIDQESVWLLGMDSQNKTILKECVHLGGIDISIIDPKLIFRRLLVAGCIGFILIHNHPSGCTKPSSEDNIITQKINNISNIIGLKFLDHVIIGNDYYSYANDSKL